MNINNDYVETVNKYIYTICSCSETTVFVLIFF